MNKALQRMIRFISFGLIVYGILIPSHDGVKAQLGLPNDLVFLIRDDLGHALVLFNHETGEFREFYRPENVIDLSPVSWSPQGDSLVVWELYQLNGGGSFDGLVAQYCTITPQGVRQVCFDSQPPAPNGGPFWESYRVTWSSDGEFVYFVTQNGSHRQLIEANAETGVTERAIYEMEYDGTVYDDGTYFWFPPDFIWTSDLQYVAVGVGDMEQTTRLLVNTENQETQDLSQIVSPWNGGLRQNMLEGTGIICESFSPQDTYLAAVDFSGLGGHRLVIFDTHLNIVDTLDTFDGRSMSISCPTWGHGDLIYLFGRDSNDASQDYMFMYNIEEHQLSTFIVSPLLAPPFILSPDGLHMAFTGYVGGYKVNIIYPDGRIELLTDQYEYSDFPLWRPVSD